MFRKHTPTATVAGFHNKKKFLLGHQNNESNIVCCHNVFFLFLIVEQLPCQQSRETAGPEIYSRPPHQHHLLQNEGAVAC